MRRSPGLTSRFQTGAISVMAAAGMAALVASALLAVDLGNLFYTKRQLQNVADTAALSAVSDLPNAAYIATDTASKNDFTVPGVHSNTLETVTGRYDTDTTDGIYQGTFSAGGDPEQQNAVKVTVTTQQPYFFMAGNREISATATATRTAEAGFSIGSGLLNIDTRQSALLNAILGKLLHTSLNLDAMSYQGLATAHVNLLDLVRVEGHVGTVNELLGLDLSLADVLHLTAQALGQNDILYLDLENLANLEALGNLHLKLGDLIKLSVADGESAASADLNVLQLISLSAQVANGDHFLDVPITNINIPGILSLDLALSLIEPPSIAIGPAGKGADGQWLTRAHTAQTRLKVDVKVLEMLGGLLHLPIYLELAKGQAWLENIECRSPLDDSTVTIGATSGIAGIYIGEVNIPDVMTNREVAVTGDNIEKTKVLDLLGLLWIKAKAGIDLPGGGGDLAFNGPFDDQNTQRISGLETAGLFSSLSNTLGLELGGPLGDLLNTLLEILLGVTPGELLTQVLDLLTPVLSLLDDILAPVLSLLGLQLGYADVNNFYLNCGVPRLVR
ncbi:MAG: pilus assembly protein TadG-related protein [Gallionellaceae bacterium]|nr:pilus assembly protein TadG-related protein [Gallionellaceae bacterium]